MNKVLIIAFFFLMRSFPSWGQEFVLDPSTKKIEWRGYGEIGGFTQEGTIDIQSSSILLDNSGLLSGEIVIRMKSIYHEDKQLMKHLKEEDFFDVKAHPLATLEFTQNEDQSISGKLTIKGVANELIFKPEIRREERKIMVKGSAQIDRTVYGIKYNSASHFQDLGNYAIKNNFDIFFNLIYNQSK